MNEWKEKDTEWRWIHKEAIADLQLTLSIQMKKLVIEMCKLSIQKGRCLSLNVERVIINGLQMVKQAVLEGEGNVSEVLMLVQDVSGMISEKIHTNEDAVLYLHILFEFKSVLEVINEIKMKYQPVFPIVLETKLMRNIFDQLMNWFKVRKVKGKYNNVMVWQWRMGLMQSLRQPHFHQLCALKLAKALRKASRFEDAKQILDYLNNCNTELVSLSLEQANLMHLQTHDSDKTLRFLEMNLSSFTLKCKKSQASIEANKQIVKYKLKMVELKFINLQ